MKTLLSNVAAALTLCLASPSYASDNLNSITQKFDAVTLSANTGQPAGINIGDLPDEIILHILDQLSLEELQRSSRIDQRCHRLANDKTLLNKWAEAAQKLNPLNPPAYNISDLHAHIIRSVLTNKLHFTIHGYMPNLASGIQDNGELIMRADLDRLGIKKHQSIAVTYNGKDYYTDHSSEDGKTHCGEIGENNYIKSYIVTDIDSGIEIFKLLKKPRNLNHNYPNAISSDGKTIIGIAYNTGEDSQPVGMNGFKWTDQTDMVLLRNSKGPFINNTQCTDKNGQLIGGFSFSTSEGGIQAALWIDGNHYLVQELLNFSSNLIPKDFDLQRVIKISPNSKAIHGLSQYSADKHMCWSLVFGDDSTDNIQQ